MFYDTIHFILHCLEISENEYIKNMREDIEDWNNVSSNIFSYLEFKDTNIAIIGLCKTGKTTFINTLKNNFQDIYEPTLKTNYNLLIKNNQRVNIIDFSSKDMFNTKNIDYTSIDGIIMIMKDDLEYHFLFEWSKNIIRKKGKNIPNILIRNKKFCDINPFDYINSDYFYNSNTIDLKDKDKVEKVFNKLLNEINKT